MKHLTLLLLLTSLNAFSSVSVDKFIGKFCHVRPSLRYDVTLELIRCDKSECYGSIVFDNWNQCDNTEDGIMCTQMGIPHVYVDLKLKENGVLKVKKYLNDEYHGYSSFESFLEKLRVRSRFKIINGEMYHLRGLRKSKMNCR